MSAILRRKKRLFEDDQQTAQTNPQNQQQNAPADAQNGQQAELTELGKKVVACSNKIKEIITKNDPYALIALDLPSMIQKDVPEFKADNAAAKEAIGAWNSFKENPSKESFEAYLNAFQTFGNSDAKQPEQKPTEQQNNNQQQNQQQNNQQQQTAQNQQNANQQQAAAQPQQNTQQPAQNNQQQAQQQMIIQSVRNQQKYESTNNDFKSVLRENLQKSMKMNRYSDILENNWTDPGLIFG